MKNLVIVESPTKARTLSHFLRKDYKITASMGHVRDLPRGEFGVDVKNNFAPQYVIPKEKTKSVNLLAREAAGAEHLWLATDPDREGEAIAWNLLEVIRVKRIELSKKEGKKTKLKTFNSIPYSRVVFHEITKDAVLAAFAHSRKIDDDLVEAQQARRVLDRLVGYKLSPLLWKKVKSGLSAGRVQSVALRLIVDREREIEAFKAQEYWVIQAELESQSAKSKGKVFLATLIKIGDKKADVKNKEQADKVVADLEGAEYKVLDVASRDVRKYPNPPFTTSTLQQTAVNRLGFTAKRTMRLAQDLYEQGLITYMRTDSVNLSPQAVDATRKYILEKFGEGYLPQLPRKYKAKSRLAQEAHEAIRPTNIQVTSDQLGPVFYRKAVTSQEHKKLYDLIWKRMIVCQMVEAVVVETTVDVEASPSVILEGAQRPIGSKTTTKGDSISAGRLARLSPSQWRSSDISGTAKLSADIASLQNDKKGRTYTLRATGQKIKFDGWYKVYDKPQIKEQKLPQLSENDALSLIKIASEQKFTEPPPRYTEATLIRELEKNDIGRPSTYAPTIATLYERVYIERVEGRKIAPTPIGSTTVDFLVKYFEDIVDLKFTAEMEDDLDKIAQGDSEMAPTMKKFWDPFEKLVEKVTEEAVRMKVAVEETDEKCEVCGRPMVIRYGKFGKFLACSGFPDCKNTKTLSSPTGLTCPADGGNIVVKKTRRGKTFWGCANYPKCKWASWTKPEALKTAT